MNRFFASGREFSLIEKMFPPDHFKRDARGLGDDAFLFEPKPNTRWVITSDASVEGVHYRLDWMTPQAAMRKALLANLSDINAMGGMSRHVFFNLGARADWDESVFSSLGSALRELEKNFDFQVSGGDTVRLPHTSFFSFTVMGEVEGRPLLRSASKPGHRIYVSGTLGASAAGLRILGKKESSIEKPGKIHQNLISCHFNPKPPLQLGPVLAQMKRDIAAIDISDGLSSELWHLSRQSDCSLCIEWEKIPVHPDLEHEPVDLLRNFVLNGGEEYQLLFTGNFSDEELVRLRAITVISEIGEVKEGAGVFLKEGGKTLPLHPGGFSHG